MKKIKILLLISLLSSCGKMIQPPLENYYLSTNKSKIFRFNESSFVLQIWWVYSWVKC